MGSPTGIRLTGGREVLIHVVAAISILFTSWSVNVLLAGRVIPWQATKGWATLFVVVGLTVGGCYLPAWRRLVRGIGAAPRSGVVLRAFGPSLVLSALILLPCYFSDQAYGFLIAPSRRMQVAALVAILSVSLAVVAYATAVSSDERKVWSFTTVGSALTTSVDAVVIASLLAVGAIEAAAMSTPIGDDIGKYTQAALAMLDHVPYPVHQAAGYLVEAGMTGNSPALPALPVLLAASFAAFGRNFAGLAIPLAALAAVFPVAMYLACLGFTRSRFAAYIGAILSTLFPVYQIHILGTAVPDTLFAVSLLLVAAAVAKAISTPTARWWALAGAAIALVANSRPEGLDFSVAMLLVITLFHWRTSGYLLAVLVYLLLMAPFAITYQNVAGSPWPTTFNGTVGPQYVQANLTYLHDLALPWYEQALGLGSIPLAVLGVAVGLAGLVALVVLWRQRPGLLFVPILGFGYILASLMIDPLILMSYTPVDVLRHWNSGVPYVVVTLTYAGYLAARRLRGSLTPSPKLGLLLALVLVVGLGIYYESDRLALPGWRFGGSASLLWTGTSYLLTDVVRNPLPLPSRDDTRSGEELRQEQTKKLGPYDLHHTNAGEPYHWTSLIVALFGLLYAAAPSAIDLVAEASSRRRRWSTALQSPP